MHPALENRWNSTRRHFLKQGATGLGTLALANLLNGETAPGESQAAANPLAARRPHFAGKAKSVIYLHLAGSPPHLDLFDYKPELLRRTGQEVPQEFLKGRRFAFTSGTPRLLGTPQPFAQYGKSGQWMSAAVPGLQ